MVVVTGVIAVVVCWLAFDVVVGVDAVVAGDLRLQLHYRVSIAISYA